MRKEGIFMMSAALFLALCMGLAGFDSFNYDIFGKEETLISTESVVELNYLAMAETYPEIPLQTHPTVNYNDSKSWWFNRVNTGVAPTAQRDISILDYDAYYLGDTSRKVIYLTFDEGYELGFTPMILDTLAKNDVKAAFFVTKGFLESQPELAKRMVEEGHVVGNHSATHPQFSTISDEEITKELKDCANYFFDITGKEMDPFFRPPAGEYSIRVLERVLNEDYKTIFWSFAYRDWITDEQPGKGVAYDMAMTYSHNGCIMLLHAVSESNALALDDIIKDLKAKGYSFESLYDLPESEKLLEALKNKR